MNLSTVSFAGFMILNAIVAGGIGYVVWRKLPAHPRRVHVVVTVAFATAFLMGALWFNLVHIHTSDPVPDNVPQGDNTRADKVMFAGFVGMLLLVLAGLVALAGYASYLRFTDKFPKNAAERHTDRRD